MTTKDEELRERDLLNLELEVILVEYMLNLETMTTDVQPRAENIAKAKLLAIITSDKQRLLKELMEHRVEVNTVQYNYENGYKMIAGFTNTAVPLSVIQNKLEGLS